MSFLAMFGVIALTLIFIAILLIYFIISLYNYDSGKPLSSAKIKIKFKQFYQWYNLNPTRWNLEDNYVTVKTYKNKYNNPCLTNGQDRICYFGYVDWRRYKKFKKHFKTIQKNKQNQSIVIEVLEVVQQDINTLRKQSIQEIEEASNKITEIAEKLNKK